MTSAKPIHQFKKMLQFRSKFMEKCYNVIDKNME